MCNGAFTINNSPFQSNSQRCFTAGAGYVTDPEPRLAFGLKCRIGSAA